MLPHNLQALRERKSNWSLADDRELRNVLEEIKSSLASKINDVSNEIHENSLKIANACVQVSNLNNRLSFFGADQFIESRVRDDTSACAGTTPTSQAIIHSKQTGTADNLRQAISMGFDLMRSHFKRIDIRPEDLDEDDDPICMPGPIFEPFDENLSRPLPFLIGSSDWDSSSCAVSSEEYAETPKVNAEVVISLPSSTQSDMAGCEAQPYSDALNGKLSRVISNQAASNTKNVEAEFVSHSDEYGSKTYTYQNVAAASSSMTSLLQEKEVENTSDFTFDLSRKMSSRRYPEASITNPEVSVERWEEVLYRPPNPEVNAKGSEITVKKFSSASTIEDESKRKISENASKTVGKLFADSSSDEDDLFSELKNTKAEAKQHIPTYLNSSHTIPIAKSENVGLQTNSDVHNSDLFADISKPKNASKTTGNTFVNDLKASNTFRNKLDGMLANKVMSKAIGGLEKHQGKETEGSVQNDGSSALLLSLARLRAKGPTRRLPSHLLRHSNIMIDNDEVKSIRSSVIISAGGEGTRTMEKADVFGQDGQFKMNSARNIAENVKSVEQKNHISSIFSSDSDDDIFSLSGKSKTKASVSELHVKNGNILSLTLDGKPSVNAWAVQTQTAKTDVKFNNLFDSDDEDVFGSTILVNKKEQQSAGDKQAVAVNIIQQANISGKYRSVGEKKETVVPRKLSSPRPKRVDIFGDDSDDDLFTR